MVASKAHHYFFEARRPELVLTVTSLLAECHFWEEPRREGAPDVTAGAFWNAKCGQGTRNPVCGFGVTAEPEPAFCDNGASQMPGERMVDCLVAFGFVVNRETKFMNRFAVGFLALTGAIAGTAGIASAADMGAPAPVYTKAPIMAPMFSWTGFYIGANVGGAWGNSSDTNAFFAPLTSTGNYSTSGGGGQAGYNWQFGSWVLGIETDGD